MARTKSVRVAFHRSPRSSTKDQRSSKVVIRIFTTSQSQPMPRRIKSESYIMKISMKHSCTIVKLVLSRVIMIYHWVLQGSDTVVHDFFTNYSSYLIKRRCWRNNVFRITSNRVVSSKIEKGLCFL